MNNGKFATSKNIQSNKQYQKKLSEKNNNQGKL